MIPQEVIEIAMLIDEDFDARVSTDPLRERALSGAWRIWNAGYRPPAHIEAFPVNDAEKALKGLTETVDRQIKAAF